MTDLSGRTVAQLKEELQSKGADVKGLKLKKDYIDKLQQVLDAEAAGTHKGEETGEQENKPSENPMNSVEDADASKDQEGKHVSSNDHPLPIQDPEATTQPVDTAADTTESNEVDEAKEDPTTAISKAEKDEQILGDADGDLAEKMEVAEEAGKQERMEEQGSIQQPQTKTEQLAAAEIKEEGQVAVEAAEAPALPIEAPATSDTVTSDQKPEQAAESKDETHERDGADKRKRSDDQDEGRDGKRNRLSPAPEPTNTSIDVAMEVNPAKPASNEPTPSKPPTHPLPETLSHVRYHATRALYISNLKRPLLIPDLKAWLLEQSASDEVKEEDVLDEEAGLAGGVWLDGVKSHCYCIGQVFPIDHGAPLTVEFVPEGLVESLVSQEKSAWENGRNKLVLEIKSVTDNEWTKGTGNEGGDLSFELVRPKTKDGVRSGGGLGNLRPPPVPRPIELRGMAPAGPAFARPTPNIRPPPADAGWGARSNRPDDAGGLQRTRTQPVLNYRESPKYAKAEPTIERGGGRWERNMGGWGNQQRNTGQGNPNNNRDNGWGRPATKGGW
ncbi:hypothetical protein QFC22_002326 [Naganishia vaughanmartiniae]|uniref:Uncharacterized protein n=1 Tax=Naganishia vaughanmartiniae TaxID=1424756 RepID=A0ACC2XF99_9TREE|nr:hypothetical protein QFC22_002326 [Naganishia vaughanmartiniae]